MSGDAIPFIDLSPTHDPIREQLNQAWEAVTSTHQFILGDHVATFEQQWAEYCETDHAVGVGSGTEAIEFALRALDIGSGDEVVVPASTFIATAAAVVACGATPVFADVERDSMLLSSETISAVLTNRTAAVIVVHLYGNPADMEPILQLASEAGIHLIEDAAQAHGARSGGKRVGSIGTLGAFSHYPTKNLGAFGDGGTVTTSDESLAANIRLFGNHGRATQQEAGYTLAGRTGRLDGLQAAILSVKLGSLDDWTQQRRQIVTWYDAALPNEISRVRSGAIADSAPHLCVVRLANRDAARKRLAQQHIGTGIHYPQSVPQTTAFQHSSSACPNADQSAAAVVSLPLWPGMTEANVERVSAALKAESPW